MYIRLLCVAVLALFVVSALAEDTDSDIDTRSLSELVERVLLKKLMVRRMLMMGGFKGEDVSKVAASGDGDSEEGDSEEGDSEEGDSEEGDSEEGDSEEAEDTDTRSLSELVERVLLLKKLMIERVNGGGGLKRRKECNTAGCPRPPGPG